MNEKYHFENLRRVLTETIAWCSPRVSVNDPANSLHTPSLSPQDFEWEPVKHPLPSDSSRQNIINNIAENRADSLRLKKEYPEKIMDWWEGKLLLSMGADDSVGDGASSLESQGFFDESDLPPWDTWICYVSQDPILERRPYMESYVLSWVPPAMIHLVNSAIEVNPVDCIHWATEYDTVFTRHLASTNLLF